MKQKDLEEKKNARRKRREKVKNTTAKIQTVMMNEISSFADPLVEVNQLGIMLRKNKQELNDVLTLSECAIEKLADRQDKLEQILFDVIVVGGVALTILGIKVFKK